MTFVEKLESRQKKMRTLLCVGLDPDKNKIPVSLLKTAHPLYEFNKAIIDNTHQYVCAYKPQVAYYSAVGAERDLEKTVDYIHSNYPDIPVILDAKRNDIGSTAEKYAMEVFDRYQIDAVTVNPYMGHDSVKPFADHKDKGVIILCKTSNASSVDLQEVIVEGMPLYLYLAKKAIQKWNYNNNILFVVGATFPQQMKQIREIAKDAIFLVPGVGAQGGSISDVLSNGLRKDGLGLIISSSREIIHAGTDENYYLASQKAAEKACNAIRGYLQTV